MTLVMAGGAGLLVLLLALALRRPMQRRVLAGTGWEKWRGVASGLPWRDRWTLYVCNSLGRAALRRLAQLAVRRGEVITAAMTRSQISGLRKILWVADALSGLAVILDVVGLFMGDRDGSDWLSVFSSFLGVMIILSIGRCSAGRRSSPSAWSTAVEPSSRPEDPSRGPVIEREVSAGARKGLPLLMTTHRPEARHDRHHRHRPD